MYRRKLVFTGDVGREDSPILRDPVPPREADILITESTYGNRLHDPEEDVKRRLAEVISATHARGGKVLIPAFSVGRTQTLVYYLHQLAGERKTPALPIFVDSPLSTNVTNVFRAHPECYDPEALEFLARQQDPFGFDRLTYVRDLDASKALNDVTTPCVIISASGMMESGRILHHLKRIGPDRKSTILIVGFMAENTLGRRIEEKVEFIKVFGEEFPLRAEVATISGLSGHADRNELSRFLGGFARPPARTFVVHGEENQALGFAEHLRAQGFPSVDVPAPGEKFEV